MNTTDVSILIPAFGPARLTDACVTAILETCFPKQVLVFDNGMDWRPYLDGEISPQSSLFAQILLRSVEGRAMMEGVCNLGFAVACNRLAAAATGDILLFLNCDTEPQEGWLDALVTAFDDPEIAVAGSRLVRADGTLHHSGIVANIKGHAWCLEIREDWPTRDVDAVTGACLAIRRDAFFEAGTMDERFFNCYEDADLCFRVLQLGKRVRYVRESLVMHRYEATGAERWRDASENTNHFIGKWSNADVPLVSTDEDREFHVAPLRARLISQGR